MDYDGPLKKLGIRCVNAPGLGEKMASTHGITGAVIIPASKATVETCGTTGCNADMTYPESLEQEIWNAFKNTEDALHAAGITKGWQAVYKMTTYHAGALDAHGPRLEVALAAFLRDNRPAWVGVGVADLSGVARIETAVSEVLRA